MTISWSVDNEITTFSPTFCHAFTNRNEYKLQYTVEKKMGPSRCRRSTKRGQYLRVTIAIKVKLVYMSDHERMAEYSLQAKKRWCNNITFLTRVWITKLNTDTLRSKATSRVTQRVNKNVSKVTSPERGDMGLV